MFPFFPIFVPFILKGVVDPNIGGEYLIHHPENKNGGNAEHKQDEIEAEFQANCRRINQQIARYDRYWDQIFFHGFGIFKEMLNLVTRIVVNRHNAFCFVLRPI